MALNLTRRCTYIKQVKIYQNVSHFYFIGEHNLKHTFLIFTIKKLEFTKETINQYCNFQLSDILVEHHKEYDQNALKRLNKELKKDKSTVLKAVDNALAIFGFVKFFFGYYVITSNELVKIGKISKYIINKVEKMILIPLFTFNDINTQLENKYVDIFKEGIEFSKSIYFSYTYNLTKTLQRNFVENLKGEMLSKFNDNFLYHDKDNVKRIDIKKETNNYFLWNHCHLKEFFYFITNKIWCAYFIHGFYEQIQCDIYGLRFLVSVIARRNRYYAGTRYLKRGINNDGNVANDVETEQILEELSTSSSEQPNISSFIHIRGSVPIYWRQEQNSILPKPAIKVNFSDIKFDATKRHFYLLTKRYGHQSLVCNLTKKKEGKKKQETLLNECYYTAIEYINSNPTLKEEEKISYYHYDLKDLRKRPKFYKDYCDESCKLIAKTNMFCFIPHIMNNNTYLLSLQKGVIRSNCIDCLDRTNVYQQVIGTAVMVIQLRMLGVEATEPDNEYEEIYGILTEIYKKMGNELSFQYAGSLAHKQTIKDDNSTINKIVQKVPEMVNTFKRYFNNSFNDQHKQNAINLFLGKYKYYQDYPELWDLENDADLHRKRNLKELGDNWAKEAMEYYSTFNLISDMMNLLNKYKDYEYKQRLIKLGEEFNLDILEKIEITKYQKILPILTSSAYESYLNTKSIKDSSVDTLTNTSDYLIRLDGYLNYKTKDMVKYYETISFNKENPIFFQLDIDPKTQIKTFETFKYGEPHEKLKQMEIKNYDPIDFDNIVILYDETNRKGISSSMPIHILEKRTSRKEILEKPEAKEVKGKSDIFNVCSFTLEEDIDTRIYDFINPNIIGIDPYSENISNIQELDYYKETINIDYTIIFPGYHFIEDLEKKMNTLSIMSRLENKSKTQNEKDYDILLHPVYSLSQIQPRDTIKSYDEDYSLTESLSSILNNCLHVKINENHFTLD